MPETIERLESDVAVRALTAVATKWPEATFLAKLPSVFGSDIPPEAYRRLRSALLGQKLVQPRIEITTTGLGGHGAGYDNSRRTILVDRQMVSMAEKHKAQAAVLLIALVEEFGHHLDNVLRTEYSQRGGDARRDEGAELVHALCKRWQAAPALTAFATFVSSGQKRKLSTDNGSFLSALGQYTSEKERAGDEKAGPVEFFGAGRGDTTKSGHSYGHESIEDALSAFFPDPQERRQIYFGNWLRDFSQVLDPKMVRPPGSRDISAGFSRAALTRVLDVKAREHFGNLEQFRVSPEKLGVYRAEEHIDNPHGIEDATYRDKDFRGKWTVAEVSIDPATGMLNYIATRKGSWVTSAGYIEKELRAAAALGRTPEGRRRFGQGLHTLEDYYSHSNFAELLLIKLGYTQVYPWVHAKVQVPAPRYPLVTGKFGSNDIQVSGAYVIAEHLKAAKACVSGERSPSMEILLVVLKDIPPEQLDPERVQKLERLLAFKEGLEKKFPWIGETLCTLSEALSAIPNAVLASKTTDYATSVTKSQREFLDNPSSTNPTHSQLAKDHDDHPLHQLTARLAMGAVRDVGKVMALVWAKSQTADDVVQAALKYLVHPEDIQNATADSRAWIFAKAQQWAEGNAAKLKRLEKAAIIERQFTEAKEHQAKLELDRKGAARPGEVLAQVRGALDQVARLA